MKKNKAFSFLLAAILISMGSYGQKTDYLQIPGPLNFNSQAYYLDWSSHPSPAYYKQEYLRKGDTTGHFSSMLMVEAVTGSINIKDVVAAKLQELKVMKQANPAVQFETFSNASTGEYMIDFLLTQNSKDGSNDIAEHNIYRYKNFTDKRGRKGLMLFALSTRAYGNNINPFLTSLKFGKRRMVDSVLNFTLPPILIK
ncbi:hypothetical protein [Ferruginibacter sp. HRS2-29]|uniref:hypothetical protein n=1 Tax=Ferruginibacter sp. HRS2-29 TaxID=2487334 RepID=UPI0020CEC3F9|nr:hypothetical protein [Ferruginibacter sp. HRS2-29]MCP9751433.1 hypothetical protein [Ferruginibacter sp. HRS2-29]